MDMAEYFANETILRVNVVKIDNKKLTKSLFNQINSSFLFDKEFNFIGDMILGYVNDKSIFAIWTKNDKLFKTDISKKIIPLSNFKPDSRKLYELEDIIYLPNYFETNDYTISKELEFNDYIPTSKVLKEEYLHKLNLLITKAKEFREELSKHQIYL